MVGRYAECSWPYNPLGVTQTGVLGTQRLLRPCSIGVELALLSKFDSSTTWVAQPRWGCGFDPNHVFRVHAMLIE